MNCTLNFQPVSKTAMTEIMPYLNLENERSCDFSYGGVLMWTDLYQYEYAIEASTLFMRGIHPDNPNCHAYTFPLGKMELSQALTLLKSHCEKSGEKLEFSSVPPEAKDVLVKAGAREVEEQTALGDYIYSAEALATLKGKKMSKKRNHVHQFVGEYPDWEYESMHATHIPEIKTITSGEVAREASQTEEARIERTLAEKYLEEFEDGNPNMLGGVLKVNGAIVAYTIGDIKGDTLYVHIEKGERSYNGSFEMINMKFVEDILASYPEIEYVNREDDAGNEGLRAAKMSYHPVEILKKYIVRFS